MKSNFSAYFILMLVLLVVGINVSYAQEIKQKTGSWGDQGDGTYKNPILNADYPDIDIEKFGDTYYMISSKQHMAPGMVILESQDLVNWEIAGHVWDKLDWAPEYNWDRMAGYGHGVWAGDLAFHEGLYYCYQIDNKHGLFVSTAQNIRGPWSKPKRMLPTEIAFDDPAVFWDYENHQAYLICNNAYRLNPDPEMKKVRMNENRIYKMSWDGLSVLDSGQVFYTGKVAEAAKIHKINGIWYILMAEWYDKNPDNPKGGEFTGNDRKQFVLRSTTNSIYGPYEKKIVFERGNGFDRSCSQGSLLQAPDSSWWYMHQLIQNINSPFQGRPQCLQPVTWVDGWPIIGQDIDDDGIGEPVWSYKKPISGFPIKAPQPDDDFETETLGHQWEWNHNPRDSHWSLTERKGWLRLKASSVLPDKEGYGPIVSAWNKDVGTHADFWRAPNTISQRVMGNTTGIATAKVDLSGMAVGQRAGMVRFGGVFHLLGIKMNDDGSKQIFFMDKEGKETKGEIIKTNKLYLRTQNNGNQALFEYSTNGKYFIKIAQDFTLEFGKWSGDRIGFFCWNNKKEEGVFDIDYFHYDYDGPKAAKN